jgi:hypothetical protein
MQQRRHPSAVAKLALARASIRVALEYDDLALAEHAVKRWREARDEIAALTSNAAPQCRAPCGAANTVDEGP